MLPTDMGVLQRAQRLLQRGIGGYLPDRQEEPETTVLQDSVRQSCLEPQEGKFLWWREPLKCSNPEDQIIFDWEDIDETIERPLRPFKAV